MENYASFIFRTPSVLEANPGKQLEVTEMAKVETREQEFLAVDEASKVIFWPTTGLKET